MKLLSNLKLLCINFFWFFYKLTPKGKEEYILRQGFKGLQVSKAKGNLTKIKVIGDANNLIKPRKILAFHKGKSITKSKKSNHQVIDQVSKKHQPELKERGIKISKKGKFQHA